MKLFLSCDIEGIAGIPNFEMEHEDTVNFRELYHQQVAWVIEGIQTSPQNEHITEITIADSHSKGLNLSYNRLADLDERISLVSGYPREDYMMSGLDRSYDHVFFVGYHAGIGELHGNMDHGYSARVAYNLWINGTYMNETTINAAYAGELGVPVTLIIGDSGLATQLLTKGMMPDVNFVTTKEALGRYAVKNLPRQKVREATIQQTLEALAKESKDYPLYQLALPARLTLQCYNTAQADKIAMMPHVRRLHGRTIETDFETMKQLLNGIIAIVTIGGTE